MKAVMVMFDSLNRHRLPPYGCDWVKAPNFQRLAEQTVAFDNFYVGSMPCMPARRELHTGRYNFLHRPWGPLELYDNSMPADIREQGITSHIFTDHHHYWREGGEHYLTKYTTWQAERGQEADPWTADLNEPDFPYPNNIRGYHGFLDRVNRAHMQDEKQQPQPRTFAGGCHFLEMNNNKDNWFLTIETFDPHEPYFVPEEYEKLYPEYDFDAGRAKDFDDWPDYRPITEKDLEKTEYYRYRNAALISMCDTYLGKVLDLFDEHELWDDTMLIVNTDHGFLLGEHDWWAKCRMPFYSEIAHTPFFVWDPRSGCRGERRSALAQTIDIAPTLLEYFGAPIPAETQGGSLAATIADDTPIHDAILFGMHGTHANVTDGRHVYMRAPVRPDNTPLRAYTLDLARKGRPFPPEQLETMMVVPPFSFTKGCSLLRIDTVGRNNADSYGQGHLLFDVSADPKQEHPIDDPELEQRMIDTLIRLMKESDSPDDQYERLGL